MTQYSKSIVAALGAATVLLNYLLPIIPEKYKPLASVLLAGLSAFGVYQVPNKPVAAKLKA